jgi:hypothetical protein
MALCDATFGGLYERKGAAGLEPGNLSTTRNPTMIYSNVLFVTAARVYYACSVGCL